MNASLMELTGGKTKAELNDWKLGYFNDTESRDKEIEELKKRLAEAEENANIFSIKEEEMRKLYKKVKTETEGLQQKNNPGETQHSIEQLRKAQESLLEHNNKITELLNQIDIVKESEAKQEELTGINEKLSAEIEELKLQLYKKKKRSIRRGRNRN
jgi:DNA repair exonuclease SbcCD ATPase subunit